MHHTLTLPPKHPFLAQEPLQEPWFSHLSHLATTAIYRSVTRLAEERQDSRLRLTPPIFAGTLPLSRAVPPDPHGKPSPLALNLQLKIPLNQRLKTYEVV